MAIANALILMKKKKGGSLKRSILDKKVQKARGFWVKKEGKKSEGSWVQS